MALPTPFNSTPPYDSWKWESVEHHPDSLKRTRPASPAGEENSSESDSPILKRRRLEPVTSSVTTVTHPDTTSSSKDSTKLLFLTHVCAKQALKPRDRYIEEQKDSALGQGAEGRVVRGIDCVTDSPVALKINHHYFQPIFAKNEARMLQHLTLKDTCHRLQIHAAFERNFGSEYVIVTDLIPEKNLAELFLSPSSTASPLDFSEIITIARQCLEYLTSLRSMKMVHGDLKPPNLIFERESRYLTVVDCGHSSFRHSFPDTYFLQTLPFRTPEEIMKGLLNSSHDIWVLGCILYQIFTGSPLFPVPNIEQVTNYRRLIEMIVSQIGLPSREFISRCNFSKDFFILDESIELLEGPPFITQNWKDSIRSKGHQMGISSDQTEQFIHLLEGMVRWENRLPPQKLLKSPLFQNDIKLHLSPDFTQDDVITLYRFSDTLDPSTPPTPSLTLDLKDRVTRTCCHIQRDPQDLYYLDVRRKGDQIFHQLICLQERDRISMDI